MEEHGALLLQWKERNGMMTGSQRPCSAPLRLSGVKDYRSTLVHVESLDEIMAVLGKIKLVHPGLLTKDIQLKTRELHVSMVIWTYLTILN